MNVNIPHRHCCALPLLQTNTWHHSFKSPPGSRPVNTPPGSNQGRLAGSRYALEPRYPVQEQRPVARSRSGRFAQASRSCPSVFDLENPTARVPHLPHHVTVGELPWSHPCTDQSNEHAYSLASQPDQWRAVLRATAGPAGSRLWAPVALLVHACRGGRVGPSALGRQGG